MSCDAYLQRIAACHEPLPAAHVPWFVGGWQGGRVHPDRVRTLLAPGTPFVHDGVRLQLAGADFAARTAAIATFVATLVRAGEIRPLTGEMYPVVDQAGLPPLLALDRAAVPWFGVRAFGVHGNGFVRTATGIEVWVATRAPGKATFANHLDNMVAGGMAIGMEPLATLVKEAAEEAGMPAALAAAAVPVGRIEYVHADGRSLKDDALFCFDIELPAAFVPEARDGEVGRFDRWPAAALAASLRSADAWKPNSALVALHFLLRHRCLDDELTPSERAVLDRALRAGACR